PAHAAAVRQHALATPNPRSLEACGALLGEPGSPSPPSRVALRAFLEVSGAFLIRGWFPAVNATDVCAGQPPYRAGAHAYLQEVERGLRRVCGQRGHRGEGSFLARTLAEEEPLAD